MMERPEPWNRLLDVNTQEFSIRRTTAADWREIRQLRLEMIRDTPTAYVETLDDALGLDEAAWKVRGERGSAEHGISVVAVLASGRWVGTMGGFVPDSGTGPLLVGVYVAPDWRGRGAGVADTLLGAVETWARTEGQQLTLHVHEDNARARAYYERQGFSATGQSVPYSLDASKLELEMVKRLP